MTKISHDESQRILDGSYEPLEVRVSRIVRRRDVGAMSHEKTVEQIMAAVAEASPPVSAEGATVRAAKSERRDTVAKTLVDHRHGDVNTAEALGEIDRAQRRYDLAVGRTGAEA